MDILDFFRRNKKPQSKVFESSNLINNLDAATYIVDRMTNDEMDVWIEKKSKNPNLTHEQFYRKLKIDIQDVLDRPALDLDTLENLKDYEQEKYHRKRRINPNLSLQQFMKDENIEL